jgi:hypothetical protein
MARPLKKCAPHVLILNKKKNQDETPGRHYYQKQGDEQKRDSF